MSEEERNGGGGAKKRRVVTFAADLTKKPAAASMEDIQNLLLEFGRRFETRDEAMSRRMDDHNVRMAELARRVSDPQAAHGQVTMHYDLARDDLARDPQAGYGQLVAYGGGDRSQGSQSLMLDNDATPTAGPWQLGERECLQLALVAEPEEIPQLSLSSGGKGKAKGISTAMGAERHDPCGNTGASAGGGGDVP